MPAPCSASTSSRDVAQVETRIARPAGSRSTTAAASPIEGVKTFAVEAGHSSGPVSYPEVPPVGGPHNTTLQNCAYYDRPINNWNAVHSLAVLAAVNLPTVPPT